MSGLIDSHAGIIKTGKKLKNSEKNLPKPQFVRHKSYMD
jgi:hypothetical protein